MIQRIQSVFILLAIALVASLMLWPIDLSVGPDGNAAELQWWRIADVSSPEASTGATLVGLAVLVCSALALNVVGLLTFKLRPLQMRLVGIACGVEMGLAGLLVYLSLNLFDATGGDFHFCARWCVPIVAAVLDFLAYRRISDDEALIRSLDRLR